MNYNVVFAVMVLKGILTEDEAQQLVEFINDKPQSTVLKDAIAAVAEIIGKPAAAILPQLGPVGPAQHAEEMAARAAAPAATPPVAPPPAPVEPSNTQGPDTVTGPDQSGNPASLETEKTEHEPNAAPEKEDPTTGKSSTDKHPAPKPKKK